MITATLLAAALTLGQMGPDQDEVSALVERIRAGLSRVDETLLSTLDAEDPSDPIEEARQIHMEVIRDLEELIRQARYQRSNQGGGGGGGNQQQQPQGGEQQQQPEQQDSNARESDGSRNQDQPKDGTQPGSSEEQPGGQEDTDQPVQEQPAGNRPEDGGMDESGPGGNEDGPPPPPDPKGDPLTQTGDERWGLLPPKLQERLVNLHVDDVPPRYRDWLSAYIRAMQKVEEQEGP